MHTFKHTLLFALLCSALTYIPANAASQPDADQDGVPDAAEALLHTDPQNADTDGDGSNDLADQNPVALDNPFQAEGKPAPFIIKQAQVEDNYDYAAQKDAPDHLEILVENQGDQPLTDLALFYSIKDEDSGKSESYLKQLTGLQIPARGEARIHVDDGSQPGHFRANPNSSYVLSPAAKQFHVELQLAGFQPVSVDIHKDKGGAEKAD